jgi:Probable zinc-ribbon domain
MRSDHRRHNRTLAKRARRKSVVPADPRQWSEKSKKSVSFFFTTKYEDREYKCRGCGKLATFPAGDQKYTYEV